MTLTERLRADARSARISKDPSAPILVTLIGEIEKRSKNLSPVRPLNDAEVLDVIGYFLKGVAETMARLEQQDPIKVAKSLSAARREKLVLEDYLPTALSEAEIEAFARDRRGAGMGEVMKDLRAKHRGAFDGKVASEIVRRVLAQAA